ncbi:uncharacterized protein LOC114516279 [Dendronephthya gigantea]|uniref:uncharacterized protein LOC114516279 n=1 Tax=Dendronephthya gigantea TaxID=151771 RepID=UPI00106A7DD7|nr:uncharacterized protein LOC114516279 [Dendronephthya gigantea]
MSTTEIILSLECSLLVLFLLLMVGTLLLYRLRNTASRNTNRPNDSGNRKYIVLPHTSAEPVPVERNVKLVNNVGDDESADHPLLGDRTEAGRLYFSLKYDEKSSIITIKLIKGENLPLITKDETKAFVSVQVISDKKDATTKNKRNTISPTYQRLYKFPLSPGDLASYTILFEISRFDRYSKKYDIGDVTVPLAELGVDISHETFFTRDIIPQKNIKADTRKPGYSTTAGSEDSRVLRRVRKDAKVKQHPQILWHKLSRAVHDGLYQGILRGRHESLQWDPFLIIQKYEYAESDEPSDQQELPNNNRKRHHDFPEETPESYPETFNSVTMESPPISYSSPQPSDSSPERLETLQTPVNREFYRLVHSPALGRSDSSEPATSWSIPETFHFPPLPTRLQSSTVVFQSAPAACRPRQHRLDRLHKLTSLSSNYRKNILRKSRRRVTLRRSKLTRMEPLHRLLYLGKDTRTERSYKRLRGEGIIVTQGINNIIIQ